MVLSPIEHRPVWVIYLQQGLHQGQASSSETANRALTNVQTGRGFEVGTIPSRDEASRETQVSLDRA